MKKLILITPFFIIAFAYALSVNITDITSPYYIAYTRPYKFTLSSDTACYWNVSICELDGTIYDKIEVDKKTSSINLSWNGKDFGRIGNYTLIVSCDGENTTKDLYVYNYPIKTDRLIVFDCCNCKSQNEVKIASNGDSICLVYDIENMDSESRDIKVIFKMVYSNGTVSSLKSFKVSVNGKSKAEITSDFVIPSDENYEIRFYAYTWSEFADKGGYPLTKGSEKVVTIQ